MEMTGTTPPFLMPLKLNLDEEPVPPPPSVAEIIPYFHQHGDRNCGNHKHESSSKTVAKYLACQGTEGRDPSTACNLACSSCHARVTLNQLHDLPCGEMICRDCLLVKAFSVKCSIEMNRQKLQESRARMTAIDLDFFNHPGMDEMEKQRLVRRYAQLRRSVLHLAGLTCCGVSMKLDRFPFLPKGQDALTPSR